jgi:hypothetical protein
VTPPHIQIIISSIREGRVGESVARWFAELAAQREDLTSELVDLREWNLPFLTLELLGIRRGLRHQQTSFPTEQTQSDGVHQSGGRLGRLGTGVAQPDDHQRLDVAAVPVAAVGRVGAARGVRRAARAADRDVGGARLRARHLRDRELERRLSAGAGLWYRIADRNEMCHDWQSRLSLSRQCVVVRH